MKNARLIFMLMIVGVNHAIASDYGIITQLYSSIFGDQDARPEYKELVVHALKDLDYESPEMVAVKQMNGLGPKFARTALSSFTAFGIWLDESYLDECDEHEKLFHVYHEAAHYVQKHHQKLMAGSVGSLAAITLMLSTLYSKKAAAFGVVTTGIVGHLYVLPYFVRNQEKEADILATSTLVKIGKQNVVEDHIQDLKTLQSDASPSVWWFLPAEQIAYLEPVISK